jgi:hypothetical protein
MFAVPTDADPQKVSSQFKDGVLNVHLPPPPRGKPTSPGRRLPVD